MYSGGPVMLILEASVVSGVFSVGVAMRACPVEREEATFQSSPLLYIFEKNC